MSKIDKKNILVVDDDNTNIIAITDILEPEYDVYIARDGKEAIEVIESDREINGVLLDLNMPNVDGFGVLEYFSTNELFKKIPVAVVTGVENQADIDKAYTYPVIEVLRKPFNERDIKAIVEKLIDENW